MKKIFLNPGHGGSDCGACGFGLTERDIVLDIGNRAAMYLREVGYNVMVFQFDGLSEICRRSDNFNADIFVSIHCNAFDGVANGTETYHYYGSAQGKKLAACIHKQMLTLPLENRNVKQAGFWVIKNTAAPAALVETAFIDNWKDNRLLASHQDDFARAIARGITDYFKE